MVVIETERLLLRPITVDDLEYVLALHSEPPIIEFLGSTTPEEARQRLEESELEWRERGYGRMAVVERFSGRFVGRIGLRYWPQFNETEAGWGLRKDAWGQGYATEAARAVIEWGFSRFPLDYLTSMIRPDNSRSLAVARRLGFRPIRDDVLLGIPVTVHALERARWGAAAGRTSLPRPDVIEGLLARVQEWAQAQADLVAVALVGSRARGTARPDSDLDLVFLTHDPARYVAAEDWAHELGASAVHASARRGVLTEQRLRLACGPEIDVGIGSPSWASLDPLDPGTARVTREGLRIIHDPDGLLAALTDAVA